VGPTGSVAGSVGAVRVRGSRCDGQAPAAVFMESGSPNARQTAWRAKFHSRITVPVY